MNPNDPRHPVSGHRVLETLIQSGAVLVLLLLLNGCVFALPVPVGYHAAGSRRNLTTGSADQFHLGKTTVQDVALALGEPDRIENDPCRLTYLSERVNFHYIWGWALPLAEASRGEMRDDTYGHRISVVFTFNTNGTLQKLDVSDTKTLDVSIDNGRN